MSVMIIWSFHAVDQAIYFGAVSQSIDLAREEGPYAACNVATVCLLYSSQLLVVRRQPCQPGAVAV
jgi:hypothetical protein